LWEKDQVEKLGKILKMNGQELLLEVEADRAAMVASHLFTFFPVKDISITEPGLETIIESIYLMGND
jgi:hypothetical protein